MKKKENEAPAAFLIGKGRKYGRNTIALLFGYSVSASKSFGQEPRGGDVVFQQKTS